MVNLYTSHNALDVLFWQHLKRKENISFIASASRISIMDCVILSVSVVHLHI